MLSYCVMRTIFNLFITENVKSLPSDFDDALQNLRQDMKEINEELTRKYHDLDKCKRKIYEFL